jgi:hypothetical protein
MHVNTIGVDLARTYSKFTAWIVEARLLSPGNCGASRSWTSLVGFPLAWLVSYCWRAQEQLFCPSRKHRSVAAAEDDPTRDEARYQILLRLLADEQAKFAEALSAISFATIHRTAAMLATTTPSNWNDLK